MRFDRKPKNGYGGGGGGGGGVEGGREVVDVKSVTVIRMTVARQSLNKAYSVSHQNQRKKLRRHKLKGP